MAKGDFLGEFETLVLMGLIHLGAKGYGAALSRYLADHAGRNVAPGAIYTTLTRLETKGYVSSALGPPTATRGGRAKRLYTIRPPGRLALYRSLTAIERLRETLPLGWAMGE